jgi:hopanoid biosynthesis associated protein HpnK
MPSLPGARSVCFTADDFGLSPAINEAVEQAYRAGVLGAASLMVAAPAAADAVARARRLPGLRVGLHLVAVEGPAVLPPGRIPDLVDSAGRFASDQLRLGLAYCRPRVARQLAAEIAAQFAAFAATGLPLAHADAHKHMHLHPVVGRLMLRIGQAHGLRRVRVPAEPPAVLARCGHAPSAGARALHAWSGVLRAQVHAAGMHAPDAVFGIAWSGAMTAERLHRLLPHLPPGQSEVYCHPAAAPDPALAALMPGYRHMAELAALLDPALRPALLAQGIALEQG